MLQFKLDRLAGKSSIDAVRAIVARNRTIASLKLTRYSPPMSLQQRERIPPAETAVIKRALRIRKSLGVPFWDAVFISVLQSKLVPFNILRGADFHATNRGRDIVVSRQSILDGALERFCNGQDSTTWTALLSEVKLIRGGYAHIPIVDLHCAESPHHERLAIEVCRLLLPSPRILLKSGKSYHAYSGQLVSEKMFLQFLGRALLYAPITDRAYIAHQIIEHRGAIRLSKGGREMKMPEVVWTG